MGTTVLLTPAHDVETATDIVVKRQVSRGFDLEPGNERLKFLSRIEIYKSLADHIVRSADEPQLVADRIQKQLSKEIALYQI
ncbi:hypothetical protein PsAD2_01576 [Pseudovibrio axinellae]|uniref:Shikimate kinase n=1 Tax=Pseudovibrio axinellae TaxID=989403 RepID=A0A165ZNF5_9HYPH|nr:hypothetical protein PsAD2_01576 [Pseudovibrio axinellae]SEQ25777.1 shikimate kinase [Pseudovibrio axinellae]